jgi:hypothetical protein
MPFAVTTFNLPGGTAATLAKGSGAITRDEADDLMRQITPGGERHGMPLLVLTQEMTRMTAEARRVFAGGNDPTIEQAWTGVVVTNPVMRVTINFLLRVARTRYVRLFSTEADAIRWLDERVRVDGPPKPARPAPPPG